MKECKDSTNISDHKLKFVSIEYKGNKLIECKKCGKRWYHNSTVYI